MFLQRIGLWPAVTAADIDEAGDEDVQRLKQKNEAARTIAVKTLELNHRANAALRDAVKRVKASSAFADFERSMHRDR